VAGAIFLLRKGSSGMLRVRTWMGADICLEIVDISFLSLSDVDPNPILLRSKSPTNKTMQPRQFRRGCEPQRGD
jgi:hypothetical protein